MNQIGRSSSFSPEDLILVRQRMLSRKTRLLKKLSLRISFPKFGMRATKIHNTSFKAEIEPEGYWKKNPLFHECEWVAPDECGT